MPKIDNIAIIANDAVTTIKARFTWGQKDDAKTYRFKAMKVFAETLKPDDFAVVDTKNGLAVVKVISIDQFADVQPDEDIDFRWAFQKVEQSVLTGLLTSEAAITDKLKAAQRRRFQDHAVAELGLAPDELKTIMAPAPAEGGQVE